MLDNSLLRDESIVGRFTPDPLRYAFSHKKGPHVGGASTPINPAQVQTEIGAALKQTGASVSRCLYIHIPFCRVRCTYCNFFQYASSATLMDKYFGALKKEILFKASLAWTQSQPFQAVYIGGGTPTDLSATQLKELGELIHQHFPLTPDCEITLEGRVNRFGSEKFEAALEGGFNRFSLGVQSFDNQVRRQAKRLDDMDVVMQRLQNMVSYNAAPVVIDLLYGLPYQTLENWQQDLQYYLESGVDGVDLYQLIEMKGLPMERMVEQGKLPEPADTAMKASMFKMGVEFMAKHHQRRLSVNHWASTNRERSIYNSLAKTNAEVLPIGAGAGGNFNGVSLMQMRDMDKYIEAVEQQHYPAAMAFRSAEHAGLFNSIKAAFDRGVLKQSDLPSYFQQLQPLFAQWQKHGLVDVNEQYLTLTLAGQFWSVTLAQNLVRVMSLLLSAPSLAKSSA